MFLEYGLFFTLIKAFSLNLNDPKINFPDTLEKLFYEKKRSKSSKSVDFDGKP